VQLIRRGVSPSSVVEIGIVVLSAPSDPGLMPADPSAEETRRWKANWDRTVGTFTPAVAL
jgi:hypothetical protein